MNFIDGEKTASPTLHVTIIVSVFSFFLIILISFILQVEIVSKGIGKTIPSSHAQIIQPEFSGQVTEILVENGSYVKKGQILIRLDPTDAKSELARIKHEIKHLEVEKNRIDIFIEIISNKNLEQLNISEKAFNNFMDTYPNWESDYFNEQAKLLKYNIDEFQSLMTQINAKIEINKESQRVVKANIARLQSALDIQDERLQTSNKLLKDKWMARSSYLNVLEKHTELEKQKDVQNRELDLKISEAKSLRIELTNMIASWQSRFFQRKSEITARLQTLNENLVSVNRRVVNAALTSPVNGVVDKLKVHTIGAVVESAQPLMHIIPENDIFELEVVFSNADSGFLEVGQMANIKFDAFPSERFGYLKGKVTHVSADAIEINQNEWGFVVQVIPSTSYLETPSMRHNLRPGMTATVDVITGKRTLINYFFAPIIKTIQDSLGER